jgi:capsular polysaccharide biosynthesis protein
VDARAGSDKGFEFLDEGPDRLVDALRVTRKRMWLITLIAIIFAGLTLGYSFAQPSIYEASTKLLVAKLPRTAPDSLSCEVQGLQQLTLTVIELINSRPVAEAVVRELDLQTTPEGLLQGLTVEQVRATSVIEVTYRDPNPQRAQQVVNAVGGEVSKRAYEGDFVVQNITVNVWERATLPKDPVGPHVARNIGVGLVAGAMLGVALAFLLEHLQWRLKR